LLLDVNGWGGSGRGNQAGLVSVTGAPADSQQRMDADHVPGVGGPVDPHRTSVPRSCEYTRQSNLSPTIKVDIIVTNSWYGWSHTRSRTAVLELANVAISRT